MYIFEIFTNEYPGEWQEHGRFRLRAFAVDGKQYAAQLEHKLLPGKIRGSEVSFFRVDIADTDKSFSTTNDQSMSVSVYAYLFGMIRPLYRDTGETLFFQSEPRHSNGILKNQLKKERIYKRSAEELAQKEGGKVYVPRNGSPMVLLTKTNIDVSHSFWMNERDQALISTGLKV